MPKENPILDLIEPYIRAGIKIQEIVIDNKIDPKSISIVNNHDIAVKDKHQFVTWHAEAMSHLRESQKP